MFDFNKLDKVIIKSLPQGQIMKKTMLGGEFVTVIDREFFKAAMTAEIAKRYQKPKKINSTIFPYFFTKNLCYNAIVVKKPAAIFSYPLLVIPGAVTDVGDFLKRG